MFHLFYKTKVTEKIYKNYVDTGNVPAKIITLLAQKVMKAEPLSDWEYAIFCGKVGEIEVKIKELTK
jgi:hypothetical protein